MSRRRVSVKELGHPDHQGWLYRKKEGKGFLGIKWKKYWFVLKKQSLYWYTNHMSEKAEGFINLTDFMIDRAIECKKKYAIKACHPQVMMFYFAAESHEDMNVWLNKLGLASIQYESSDRNAVAECYSEASDHEDGETTDAPPPYCEQTILGVAALADSGHQEDTLPPPYTSPLPSEANGSLSSPVSTMTSQSSASSLAKHRQSWLDLVSQAAPAAGGGETTVVCVSAQVHTHQHHQQQQQPPQEEEDETQALLQESPPAPQDPSSSSSEPPKAREQPPAAEGQTHVEGSDTNEGDGDSCSDEMERLYNHLKQASLSPIGDRKPSTKRDFRASFIKRCKNHTINDKLHLIRTLNSTLKSKETDLQALEQVLSDPELTSDRFREWKEANSPLHQEICFKYGQQGAAEELPATTTTAAAEAMAAPVVETSL